MSMADFYQHRCAELQAENDKLRQIAADLMDEGNRLNAVIHQPESDEFLKGVSIEAEFQQQKWSGDDATKTARDWYHLIRYLAGKALNADRRGDLPKLRHHIVTSAAACANWHKTLPKE